MTQGGMYGGRNHKEGLRTNEIRNEGAGKKEVKEMLIRGDGN